MNFCSPMETKLLSIAMEQVVRKLEIGKSNNLEIKFIYLKKFNKLIDFLKINKYANSNIFCYITPMYFFVRYIELERVFMNFIKSIVSVK